jgi:hypothetical protein
MMVQYQMPHKRDVIVKMMKVWREILHVERASVDFPLLNSSRPLDISTSVSVRCSWLLILETRFVGIAALMRKS